jgi:hypothetical protein
MNSMASVEIVLRRACRSAMDRVDVWEESEFRPAFPLIYPMQWLPLNY